jgi:hypothetical protein
MSDSKISYFNTMIFTIITGIFSLLLLLVLLFSGGRKVLPMIITIEVGAFLIIAVCITQIILNERSKDKNSNDLASFIKFVNCPDYYMKRFINDKEICSNEHSYVDPHTRQVYIMKLIQVDSKNTLPLRHDLLYNDKTLSSHDKFHLTEVDNEKLFKDATEKCQVLFTEPAKAELKEFSHYRHLPWTTMQSKCRAILKN